MAFYINLSAMRLKVMDAAFSSVDEDTVFDIMEDCIEPDVAPVVRCKDCMHHDVAYCRDHKTVSKTDVWCVVHEERCKINWFCADGERKDGGE